MVSRRCLCYGWGERVYQKDEVRSPVAERGGRVAERRVVRALRGGMAEGLTT